MNEPTFRITNISSQYYGGHQEVVFSGTTTNEPFSGWGGADLNLEYKLVPVVPAETLKEAVDRLLQQVEQLEGRLETYEHQITFYRNLAQAASAGTAYQYSKKKGWRTR